MRVRNLITFLLLMLVVASPVRAQIHTVTFSTSDPGVSAAIPYWGLDTRWPSSDNMRRGLIFMGSENVNVVDMPATLDAPLVGGDISAADKARLQQSINLAAMAGPNAMWNLSGGQPV